MSKRKQGTTNASRSHDKGDFTLLRHPFDGVPSEELREFFHKKGQRSAEEFPSLLTAIDDRLGRWFPPFFIASIAGYGLLVGVGSEGVASEGFGQKIQQHHVEMLQALALRRPAESWGDEPPDPQTVQEMIDDLIGLAEAFHSRRLIAVAEERSEQERIVLGLQERLRSHTQIVRNWGYFSAVVRISIELYGPMDAALSERLGFSATDLIKVAGSLISSLEDRASERMRKLQIVVRATSVEDAVKAFFAEFAKFEGSPDEFLASMPDGITLEDVKYRLLALSDIELMEHCVADVPYLAQTSGCSRSVVGKVLAKLSHRPGALKEGNVEHYFMTNPVWVAPGIDLGGEYFFPAPQCVFSHIHAIMASLAEEAGQKKALESRRAEYLETAIKKIVAAVFGDAASIARGAKWKRSGVQYETDLICRVDRTILIIEAKSAALSPEGLRGAPDRARRHVRELIVDPAEQSQRLKQLILDAKLGSEEAVAVCLELDIEAGDVDSVVRVSVTLDDFSVISSAEGDLKSAGWVPADLGLAPTMNLADFEVVADVLSEPAFFIHYLAERERIQKTIDVLGFEIDFLGLYLETGFNFASIENGDTGLVIIGMSAKLDKYFGSLDAGVVISKPAPRISDELAKIISAVGERRAKGWTTISVDLLRVGNLDEQRRLFKALKQLRRSVSKEFKNPKHLCSLVVSLPAHHEACVVFYVYPHVLRHRRDDVLAEIAGNAMANQGRGRCTIVGRMLERWEQPYQFVALAYPPKGDEQSFAGGH